MAKLDQGCLEKNEDGLKLYIELTFNQGYVGF